MDHPLIKPVSKEKSEIDPDPSNPTLDSNKDPISSASPADDQTATGETDVTGPTASLPVIPGLNDGTSPVALLTGTFGPSSDSGSAVVAANPGYSTFLDDTSTLIS